MARGALPARVATPSNMVLGLRLETGVDDTLAVASRDVDPRARVGVDLRRPCTRVTACRRAIVLAGPRDAVALFCFEAWCRRWPSLGRHERRAGNRRRQSRGDDETRVHVTVLHNDE